MAKKGYGVCMMKPSRKMTIGILSQISIRESNEVLTTNAGKLAQQIAKFLGLHYLVSFYSIIIHPSLL